MKMAGNISSAANGNQALDIQAPLTEATSKDAGMCLRVQS